MGLRAQLFEELYLPRAQRAGSDRPIVLRSPRYVPSSVAHDTSLKHWIHSTGLIVNVSRGRNDSDIELVKDLVETYIARPSCLILLTVACESKFRGTVAISPV